MKQWQHNIIGVTYIIRSNFTYRTSQVRYA